LKRQAQPAARPNGLAIRYGRLRFLAISAVILFLLLGARLFQLQILKGSEYAQKARSQQIKRVELASHRGKIVDRNNQELAIELPQFYSVGAYPKQVNNPNLLCAQLSSYTGRPTTHYLKRLQSRSKFVYLEWRLDEDQMAGIEKLGINGINLNKDAGRFYPYHQSTSQLLGFTDVEKHGIAGLEIWCDSLLQGNHGWETRLRDANGLSFWDPSRSYSKPRDGGTVRLTIDAIAQEILHDELQAAQDSFRSAWAGGILVNPHTGEILAVCSVPDFDPMRPEMSSQGDHKLRPFTDLIEPGSVFKAITATAALDLGIVRPADQFYCEGGAWRLGSKTLHDAHPYGWLSFEDVIVHSSNIGTAKVAFKVGSRDLYRYASRLGFGLPTNVEFPGEAAGQLRAYDEWGDIHRANIAIGQGVSVTMLQIAMAYSAIVNDGIMMEPRLILDITNADGAHQAHPPQEVGRVMEPQTARTLQRILVEVVNRGTGKAAAIDSVVVGGKTGTAQIPNLTNGGYYSDKYVGSFVGFTLGLEEDRLLYVAVCDPKGVHYGATVAAPVVKNVFTRLMPLDMIRSEPIIPALDPALMVSASDTVKSRPTGKTEANLVDLTGLKLLDIARNYTGDKSASPVSASRNVVPDLKGLSLRDAVRLLSERSIKYQITGSGWVIDQSLLPGSPVTSNLFCILQAAPLKPPMADSLSQDTTKTKPEVKVTEKKAIKAKPEVQVVEKKAIQPKCTTKKEIAKKPLPRKKAVVAKKTPKNKPKTKP
jgi:cell division protein FtsI (penicillin-binding protein 3)